MRGIDGRWREGHPAPLLPHEPAQSGVVEGPLEAKGRDGGPAVLRHPQDLDAAAREPDHVAHA